MSFSAPHDQSLKLHDLWAQRQLADDVWPNERWRQLCSAGVTRWTIPTEFGGDNQPDDAWLDGSIELARGDLLTTFIFSQYQAACQRIATGPIELKQRWLAALANGSKFATVGISHLTTSRQHTAPAVAAVSHGDGFRLTGEVPWVTGSTHADVVVTGGTLGDGRQILAAIPTNRRGVEIGRPHQLLALTGSATGSISLSDVEIDVEELIAGPVERVIQQAGSGGAGSLMTSALAIGHALGCIDRLQAETTSRQNLTPMVQSLATDAASIRENLLQAARRSSTATPEELRARATDLALRSSQALLTATKGAGFVAGHPAEVLCRQALFFLVWSCPQAVANHLLQYFSGCEP